MKKVVIIGAGLTGLCAAHSLLTHDPALSVTIVEEQNSIGGLAKTLKVLGGAADIGPHRYHSRKKEIMVFGRDVLNGRMNTLRRSSHIYMAGKYFRYPLEGLNMALRMPPTITTKIFIDYIRAVMSDKKDDSNFKGWVISRFGKKIYDIYFGPYTEKVWGIPTHTISADWADQRIQLLNLKQAIISAIVPWSKARRSLVSKFDYPMDGGIGSLSDALRRSIEDMGGSIYTGFPVSHIRISGKNVIVFSDDMEITGDFLISTIPISDLVYAYEQRPPTNVLKAASKLKFRSLRFVYLKIPGRRLRGDHWIYFPQSDIIFNRLSEEVNFNPALVPEGYTIVCAEVTCSMGDRAWSDDDWLVERVITDMKKVGLLDSDSTVEKTAIHSEKAAYPIYDLNYRNNLQIVMDWLKKQDSIVSAGRNGLFRYNNMDHSVEMGLMLGKLISKMESPDVRELYEALDSLMKEKEFLG